MDTPTPGGFLPPGLMNLLNTAQREIDRHVNDHGSCAACGSGWPCQRAALAEFALGVL